MAPSGAIIRDAQLAKTPYTIVDGKKEVAAKSGRRANVALAKTDLGIMTLEAFMTLIGKEAELPY